MNLASETRHFGASATRSPVKSTESPARRSSSMSHVRNVRSTHAVAWASRSHSLIGVSPSECTHFSTSFSQRFDELCRYHYLQWIRPPLDTRLPDSTRIQVPPPVMRVPEMLDHRLDALFARPPAPIAEESHVDRFSVEPLLSEKQCSLTWFGLWEPARWRERYLDDWKLGNLLCFITFDCKDYCMIKQSTHPESKSAEQA